MIATAALAFGGELGDQLVSRVGIVEIVVGEFLALQLRRGGYAEALLSGAVEGRRLMRVLAIAKRLGEPAGDQARRRVRLALDAREPG